MLCTANVFKLTHSVQKRIIQNVPSKLKRNELRTMHVVFF